MAIGLNNVRTRRPQTSGEDSISKASRPWSERGLAKEGRSVRRERALENEGFGGSIWIDWAGVPLGARSESRVVSIIDRWLQMEAEIVGIVIRELLERGFNVESWFQIYEKYKGRVSATRPLLGLAVRNRLKRAR